MDRDTLGDFCKEMERAETDRRAPIGVPVYIRIDGAGFSNFTRKMNRPFDERMTRAMIKTTRSIMEDYHAVIGYTQSDEISLIFHNVDHETHHGGKYQKIVSRLAAKATSQFAIHAAAQGLEDFVKARPPEFDTRAFATGTLENIWKIMLWRKIDASKNSVQMVARHYYSSKQLFKKNKDEQIEMLKQVGVDFYSRYPAAFREGTAIQRKTEWRRLTEAEMANIPAKHRPTGSVQRHKYVEGSLDIDNMGIKDIRL